MRRRAAFRRRRGQLTSADQIERIIGNVEGVVSRASARMQGRLHGADVAQRLAGIDRELGVICLRTGQTAEARRRLWGNILAGPSARVDVWIDGAGPPAARCLPARRTCVETSATSDAGRQAMSGPGHRQRRTSVLSLGIFDRSLKNCQLFVGRSRKS